MTDTVEPTQTPHISFERARKTVEQMCLINGFMFDSVTENEDDAKIVVGNILKTIFGRQFKNITINSQKQIQAIDTMYHGIRLDTYITEDPTDNTLSATIFDIEMEDREADKPDLPRRLRYYGSMGDSKLLESGEGYDQLPNFVSITILSYDPFGAGDMFYEARSVLTSHPDIEYKDGLLHLFFYCYGKPNPKDISGIIKSPSHSKKLQEMLKYIVSGENPTKDKDIDAIDDVVTRTKARTEVSRKLMRQADREYSIKKETKKDDALQFIISGKQNGIQEDVLMKCIHDLGFDDDEIKLLFEQAEKEVAARV